MPAIESWMKQYQYWRALAMQNWNEDEIWKMRFVTAQLLASSIVVTILCSDLLSGSKIDIPSI